MTTTTKVITLLSFALIGTTGCAMSSDGIETVGQAQDGLKGCDSSGTRFYVPPANDGAKAQIRDLKKHHNARTPSSSSKWSKRPKRCGSRKARPRT